MDKQLMTHQPGSRDGFSLVEVIIAIGSLSLGSVTSQAMGEDFFNVEAFPTAVFKADLIRSESGYVAEGDLTIKEQTVPVSFPFDLSIADGVARVAAQTTLDRRNYNVGTQSQPDESNVGFGVSVAIDLSASKEG